MTAADFLTIIVFLLPVSFISGWWVAKKKNPESPSSTSPVFNPDYFKGLNYVLNEQPDKAIEVFVKMLEVDSETVETHLALGNLFRRRGEVDRAIRIHQNLIARPSLDQEQRALALLELGLDYMRSGLFDRAEGLFKQLVDMGRYKDQACRHLLDIYQQESDWEKAIVVARDLESSSNDKFDPIIAQFYCELADEEISQGRNKEARENLRKALNRDPACVRASILEGQLLEKEEKYKSALKSYKRVEKQDADYLPEVIHSIIKCYQSIGQAKTAHDYLQACLTRHRGTELVLLLSELLIEQQGETEALNFISDELRKRPSVKGVDHLLKHTLHHTDGEIRRKLETIKELTENLLDNKPAYQCQQCGFEAKLIHWQCPGCKSWTTLKPTLGVESE